MQVQFDFDSCDVYDTFLKQNREREAANREFLDANSTTDDDLAYRSLVHNFLRPAIASFTLKSDSTEYTLGLFKPEVLP